MFFIVLISCSCVRHLFLCSYCYHGCCCLFLCFWLCSLPFLANTPFCALDHVSCLLLCTPPPCVFDNVHCFLLCTFTPLVFLIMFVTFSYAHPPFVLLIMFIVFFMHTIAPPCVPNDVCFFFWCTPLSPFMFLIMFVAFSYLVNHVCPPHQMFIFLS